MRKAKEKKLKGNLKTTGYPLMMILFLKCFSKNLFSFVHNNKKSWTGYPSVMTVTLSHQGIFSGCPRHLTGEIIKLNVVTILKFKSYQTCFVFLFFCFLTLPRVVWLKLVILSLQNHHLVHAWTASSATAILFNTPLEALHCVKVIIFQFDFCFRKKEWNCTEANLACTAGSKWRLCLFPP